MQYAAAYVTALIVFVGIDVIWLSVMGNALYRRTLGDILLPTLRAAPAIVFYARLPYWDFGVCRLAFAPRGHGGHRGVVRAAVRSLGLLHL